MTEVERRRFVQRRQFAVVNFAMWGIVLTPVLLAIPFMFVAVVLAGIAWVWDAVVNGPAAWALFRPAMVSLVVLWACAWAVYYVLGLTWAFRRTLVPDDAVLRILEIDIQNPAVRCRWRPAHPLSAGEQVVQIKEPRIGTVYLRIDHPPDGELRRTTEKLIRVAWSPLRRHRIEWVEVPESWPGVLDPARDQSGVDDPVSWLTSLTDLQRIYSDAIRA